MTTHLYPLAHLFDSYLIAKFSPDDNSHYTASPGGSVLWELPSFVSTQATFASPTVGLSFTITCPLIGSYFITKPHPLDSPHSTASPGGFELWELPTFVSIQDTFAGPTVGLRFTITCPFY